MFASRGNVRSRYLVGNRPGYLYLRFSYTERSTLARGVGRLSIVNFDLDEIVPRDGGPYGSIW